ncbi:Sir2 family NAD-dependent protein deacetylase [Rhodococcus maanshanensis]|uniref:NAD-dependent protein deacetylase n=1 Tax=Rhodococcus maanshanensis TaxID=183556 RepID=A0A1H7S1E7_9NOCA|nr:Sir2 family NAD-dependent protein deacetylase [Rhodococcus maanshanensis]SEL66352.1 NAD-dependent protein deacetylase, SIR2 family [Rhodococcus maanshanensis]
MSAPPLETPASEDSARLADLVSGRRVVALTGAGMSTDSGIPDYRGPDSPPRTPMTFQQFMGDAAFRRHYWARNHLGWRHMDASRPNAGHRALAGLERAGVVGGVLTQNVDLLHTKAGSRRVIDLHGSYAQVRCMGCEALISRFTLAQRLDAANPGFAESVSAATGVEIAPDADAVIEETAHFVMVDCEHCGGILKPDIVYFGESVPKPRVEAAFAMVAECELLLVLGSSLTVMSGLRFVRRAAKDDIPVVIVNRGPTRGDEFATLKLDAGCSEVLTALTPDR